MPGFVRKTSVLWRIVLEGGRNQPARLVRGALTELALRPGGLLAFPFPAGLHDGNACRAVVGSCLHRWHVDCKAGKPSGGR